MTTLAITWMQALGITSAVLTVIGVGAVIVWWRAGR